MLSRPRVSLVDLQFDAEIAFFAESTTEMSRETVGVSAIRIIQTHAQPSLRVAVLDVPLELAAKQALASSLRIVQDSHVCVSRDAVPNRRETVT